ncbi:kinase-like protein [Gigaspora margarita]|uniref:Kinase-like protein n=1 Tax=Gigaspora margarita TaxID=4874 RepID=A0A8H3WUW0_GIGMA|nr:kinase-like protein [Gigaspora margarita]
MMPPLQQNQKVEKRQARRQDPIQKISSRRAQNKQEQPVHSHMGTERPPPYSTLSEQPPLSRMEIQLPYSTLPTHVVMTADQRSQSDITWYSSGPTELMKQTDPRPSWSSQNPHYSIRYDWPQHSMHSQSTWLHHPHRYLNIQNNDWRPRSQNDDKASSWPVDSWELRPSNVPTSNQSNKPDLVSSSKSNDWKSEDMSSHWGQAENWELRSSNVSNSIQSDLSTHQNNQNNDWRPHSQNVNRPSHWQPVKNWELHPPPNISGPPLSDMRVPYQNKDWQPHPQNVNGSTSWQQVKTLQFQPPSSLNLIQEDDWHSYSPNDDISSSWKSVEGLEVRSLNVTGSLQPRQSDIVTPAKRKSGQKNVSKIVKKPNIQKDLNTLKFSKSSVSKKLNADDTSHGDDDKTIGDNLQVILSVEEQVFTSSGTLTASDDTSSSIFSASDQTESELVTQPKKDDSSNDSSLTMLTPPLSQTDGKHLDFVVSQTEEASKSLQNDLGMSPKKKVNRKKSSKVTEKSNVKNNFKDPDLLKFEEKIVNDNDTAYMICEEQTPKSNGESLISTTDYLLNNASSSLTSLISSTPLINEKSRKLQTDTILPKIEEESRSIQADLDSQKIEEESGPVQVDLDLNQIEEELVAPTKKNSSTRKPSKLGRKPGVKQNRKDQKSPITAQVKNSARVTSRKGKERVVDNAPVVRSIGEQASESTNISLNGRVGSSTDASKTQLTFKSKSAESLFNFYQSLKPPSSGLTREQMLRLGTYIFDELLSTSYARPFVNPEAEDAYYYRSIIKNLMDLNTAERKLWARFYSSPLDLYKDICQIMYNAFSFHREGDIIYEEAKQLSLSFQKAVLTLSSHGNSAQGISDSLIKNNITLPHEDFRKLPSCTPHVDSRIFLTPLCTFVENNKFGSLRRLKESVIDRLDPLVRPLGEVLNLEFLPLMEFDPSESTCNFGRLYVISGRTSLINCRDDKNAVLVIIKNIAFNRNEETVKCDALIAKPFGELHALDSMQFPELVDARAWIKCAFINRVTLVDHKITRKFFDKCFKNTFQVIEYNKEMLPPELHDAFIDALQLKQQEDAIIEPQTPQSIWEHLVKEARARNVPIESFHDLGNIKIEAEGTFKRVFHFADDTSFVVQNFKQITSDTLETRVREAVCCLKTKGVANAGQIRSIYKSPNDELVGLSMERYEQTLKDYAFNSRRVLTGEQKYKLIVDMLRGIRAIHQAGFAHRDLSEVNMMVSETREKLKDGSTMPELVIIDFGKAEFVRPVDVKRWSVGTVEEEKLSILPMIKTPPDHGYRLYRSIMTLPKNNHDKEILGPYDPCAEDIYSIGVLIWRTFSGQAPWNGLLDTNIKLLRELVSNAEKISLRIEKDVRGECSKRLLYKSLDPNPQARSSADELLRWVTEEVVKEELVKEWSVGGRLKKPKMM